MNNPQEWIPLMEGVRIIARALSGAPGDAFAKEILVQAAGVLERAGREGRLRAEGVRYLDCSASPLAAEDWMSLQVYASGKLDDPHRNLRAFRARITKVVVDARDLRRVVEEVSSRLSSSSEAIVEAENKSKSPAAPDCQWIPQMPPKREGRASLLARDLLQKAFPMNLPTKREMTDDQFLDEAHKHYVGEAADRPKKHTILRVAGRLPYPSTKGI